MPSQNPTDARCFLDLEAIVNGHESEEEDLDGLGRWPFHLDIKHPLTSCPDDFIDNEYETANEYRPRNLHLSRGLWLWRDFELNRGDDNVATTHRRSPADNDALIVKVGLLVQTYFLKWASWLKGSRVEFQRAICVSKNMKIWNKPIRSSSERYEVIWRVSEGTKLPHERY